MNNHSATSRKTTKKDVWSYAIGESGTAIPLLTIGNFAMVFYTQALGLPAEMAAIALSITTFWDAITDPVMGHITDNTKSRYGRRHPFMLLGGILVSLSLYSLWSVPDSIISDSSLLFAYILVVNIVLRTAVTVFVIPFTALGFEMCTSYESRASLQSIRYVVNMAINFLFGAMAWTLFFKDGVNADGSRLDGTKIMSNYESMGVTISIATLVLTVMCCYLTRNFIVDSREMKNDGKSLSAFLTNIKDIFKDNQASKIFMFYAVAQIGVGITAQMQIYTYIDYMQLTSFQKTIVHSSTMLGFTVGSLLIMYLVKVMDKRNMCILAAAISLGSGLISFFTFGRESFREILLTQNEWFTTIPFSILQGGFWLGCGIIIPLAISMIADVSELNYKKTGQLKDGSYSAIFSFILKAATSIGILICGFLLKSLGYQEGVSVQTPDVAHSIANFSFLGGPAVMILSLIFLLKYKVTRETLKKDSTIL